jgi:hypothetical protein
MRVEVNAIESGTEARVSVLQRLPGVSLKVNDSRLS